MNMRLFQERVHGSHLICFFWLCSVSSSIFLCANDTNNINWVDPCVSLWQQIYSKLAAIEKDERVEDGDPKLRVLFDRFEADFLSSMKWRLDLSAPGIKLDANELSLFGKVPDLPAEKIVDGRWLLPKTRWTLLAKSLYVKEVLVQANRTLRLARVTLFFDQGPPVSYFYSEPGKPNQGREFSRKEGAIQFAVQPDHETTPARKIRAIEFEGSAQDNNFHALLRFQFIVPDPDSVSMEKWPTKIKRWKNFIRDNQSSLSQEARSDLLQGWMELGKVLGINRP